MSSVWAETGVVKAALAGVRGAGNRSARWASIALSVASGMVGRVSTYVVPPLRRISALIADVASEALQALCPCVVRP